MSVLVTDTGFSAEDWSFGFYPADALPDPLPAALALDMQNSFDPRALVTLYCRIDLIRIHFPAFADGRGFSQARRLRQLGYTGRLRAFGPVLADQYPMARRCGFDEVEIPDDIARRQPQCQWLARRDWHKNDYQTRLRQFDGL